MRKGTMEQTTLEIRPNPDDFLPPELSEVERLEKLLDSYDLPEWDGESIPGMNPYTPNSNHYLLFELLETGVTLEEIAIQFDTNLNNARTYISNIRKEIKEWGKIKLDNKMYFLLTLDDLS